MRVTTIKSFNEFVQQIKENGYDAPIATSGQEQSGKSSFSMQCAINKLGLSGQPEKFLKFLDKNVIFNPNDIWKIRNLPPNAEVPVDEAIRVAWRREFYRPENRWLVKLYRQFGRFRRTYYLNIPKFWSLDEEILSDRVKIWVHIIKKDVKNIDGKPIPTAFHAVIFQKDYHAYQDDPWLRRQIRKQLKDDNKRQGVIGVIPRDITSILKRYVNLPTFWGYMKFPPLEKELWDVYDKYSLEKKLSYEKREGDETDKWKFRLYTMLYNMLQRGMTRRQITEDFLTIDNIPLLEESWISKNYDDIIDMVTARDVKELKSAKHKRKIRIRRKRELNESSQKDKS